MAKYSKSSMCFPKNHVLWKYSHDIEMRGVVSGYSTSQSEHQHKDDAKKPAKRSNFNRTLFNGQMAKYLSRRDALLDGTEKASNRKVDAIVNLDDRRLQEASLGAPLNNGKPTPISRSLMRQIRVCLDTEIEGRKATRNVKNMPKPTYNSAIFYTTLKIPVLTDDDGELYLEKLRASPNYRGNEWMDYAEIEGGYYGRILQFFHIKNRDWDLDLCLLEPYVAIQDIPHITGMEVLQPYSGPARERTKVTCTRNIRRQVHIMPDFATFQDEYGYHTQYLLNHDINPQSWAENKGLLLDLQEEIITWE
ncbi:hypothetical protein BCR43DRAFT_518802 [Syncephalastrum racemosum]|uniref:Uncharacterized protein n=1 Tax=Syncephalastrum racemosum TaxID=13706 RepID=A0A1X2GZS2_SYNRA|nr:hypothetical protein BCR43DRAFT_518802 [Syncephalastrum racemosum]